MSRAHIDGVLLLDKPSGLSSAAAVARVRRTFCAAKAGHTGTLDPLASGLLPLCLGEATKFASDLLDADKEYRAWVALGAVTTTGDAEGEVLTRASVDVDDRRIEAALARLRGPIDQVPPMYSAVKLDGRALYSYARAGLEVERPSRRVTIDTLELTAWRGTELEIRVACSKGTYIRVLAEELGRLLGCGAHLAGLRRTRVGTLKLEDAVALADVEAATQEQRCDLLLPLDCLVQGCTPVELDEEHAARFCLGQRLALGATPGGARVRVYARATTSEPRLPRFLGIGELDAEGVLHPRRVLAGSTGTRASGELRS